jgi:hypothetical protein
LYPLGGSKAAVAPPVLVAFVGPEPWTVVRPNGTVCSAPVTVKAGDVLVVFGAVEDGVSGLSVPTGGGLTYAQQQKPNTTDDANLCDVFLWTSVASADATFVVQSTLTSSIDRMAAIAVEVWRGSGGVGASAGVDNAGVADPVLNVTTTAANSAVTAFFADWNAVPIAGLTWKTINGITPTRQNGYELLGTSSNPGTFDWAVFSAYWPNVGAAGSKTTGELTAAGQKPTAVAVEIFGLSGAGIARDLAASASASASASGAVARDRPLAAPGVIAASATAVAAVERSAAGFGPVSASGVATVGVARPVAASAAASGSASGGPLARVVDFVGAAPVAAGAVGATEVSRTAAAAGQVSSGASGVLATTLVRWTGNGLSPGTFTIGSTGSGDIPAPTSVQGTAPTVDASGARSPQVKWPASDTSYIVWSHSAVSQAAWRWYHSVDSLGGGYRMALAWTGSAVQWMLDVTFAGVLQLVNNAGSVLDQSGSGAIAVGTAYRIEVTYNAGATDVYLYVGESTTPTVHLVGAQSSVSAVEFWWGCTFAASMGARYGDSLGITDTAFQIGPATAGDLVALDGSAASSGSSGGSASLARPLGAVGPVAVSAGGVLESARPLTAVAPVAGGGAGDVAAARVFSGSAAVAAGASGAAVAAKVFAGTGPAAAGGTGATEASRPLVGSGSASAGGSGAVGVARPVAGSGAATSGATGDLSIQGQRALAGVGAISASASGALVAARPVAGSGTASAAGSGTAGLARPVVGVAPAAAGAAATLGAAKDLTGSASATSGAGAALVVARGVLASAPVAAGATGVLGGSRGLAGSAPVAVGAVGGLVAVRFVVAGGGVVVFAVADLEVMGPMFPPKIGTPHVFPRLVGTPRSAAGLIGTPRPPSGLVGIPF